MDQLTIEEFNEMCQKFKISQKHLPALDQIKIKHQAVLKELAFHRQAKPSQIYRILHPFNPETLLYAMAKSPGEESKKEISHYLTTLRSTKIFLTGKNLKAMGYQPGPIFKTIQKALLEAKLDGEIKTKQDEVNYVTQKFLSPN